ncbi:hypothetical protein COO60DRAFT_220740 [Scenedesmus sp. NREL 46B-D3]|nr:hypothetical protein COO60DRAFT_220740 [Scenedesmus sp. NREL 46B-D3]
MDVPAACAAAAAAAAAVPGGRSVEAVEEQSQGLGLSAGLIKGPAGLGLSPEPSDLRIESSKTSMRAQQPSPLPPALSTCDGDTDSSSDDSSSSADDGSGEELPAGISATRKLKLPVALRAGRSDSSSSSHAAQLAVTMSTLKFALLLGVAKGQAGSASAAATSIGSSSRAAEQASAAINSQASPLRRLMRVASVTAAGSADGSSAAGEQPVKPGGIAAADVGSALAAAAGGGATAGHSSTLAVALSVVPAGEAGRSTAPLQHPAGSGRIAGGGYGDGPLLASAVLLQLTGQARKHALLDATSRIAHWVEYDAVKVSGTAGAEGAQEAGAAAVATVAAGGAADGSGAAAPHLPGGLQTPGGTSASAASSMALPKPRSKKRQVEEAEEEAQMRKQQAAEQLLLQRLAAAARQADRVAQDGASLAGRFALPAPAHKQRVQVKVQRVDKAALLAQREASAARVDAAGGSTAELGRGSRFSSMAGAGASAGYSQPGTPPAQEYAVLAVPVRQEVLEFGPHARSWAGLTPSHRPIQSHPSLPMQRPRPLLLPAAGGMAGVPQAAAAAGAGGVVGPAGRLLPGVGVGANAGLVAAARAVHAREALLAAMPRTAVYSFSVVSDHNRSGRMDDGYSKAPSTADLDNLEDISPRKGRQTSAAAAAAAARLGGMHAAGMADQSGCYSVSEASSPSKSPTRSPTKRQQAAAHAGGLLASLVG